MRSHPGTGWFVALVVFALLAGGWPRQDETERARRPEREWRPGVGEIVMRVPRGWHEVTLDGMPCLVRDASRRSAGLCTISIEPKLVPAAAADADVELESALTARPDRRIERSQRLTCAGEPALRIDWSAGSGEALAIRGTELVVDRRDARIELAFVAARDEWAVLEREVEVMLASLEFEAR